jgi:GNAT superfamily N-acetyltransferase
MTAAPAVVRDACADDALEVAQVHVRAWQVGYRGLMPDAYLDGLRAADRARWYTFGDPDPARPQTMVAVEEGRIRGFATVGPSRDGAFAGELMALNVDPDHWGRGIGRTLINASCQRLIAKGYPEAVLWVLERNTRAIRFYESHGWSVDGARRTETVWGIQVDELCYRRALR